MMRPLLKGAIALAILAGFSGCSLWQKAEIPLQKPTPTTLDISVIASETKSPVAVHFFALESAEKFKKLDYFELMKKLRRKSSVDIEAHSKEILLPGEMEKRSIRLDDDVHYYAVVVGFKDVEDNDNWRFIQRIIPHTKNDITLIIEETSMRKISNKGE